MEKKKSIKGIARGGEKISRHKIVIDTSVPKIATLQDTSRTLAPTCVEIAEDG